MNYFQYALRRLSSFALLSLTLVITQVPSSASSAALIPDATNVQEAREIVTTLAGPDFRGRDALSGDESLAAGYVLSRLRELGLRPAGENGSFVQHFNLVKERPDARAIRLKVGGTQAVYGKDYGFDAAAGPLDATMPVVSLTVTTPEDITAFVEKRANQLKGTLVLVTERPKNPRDYLAGVYPAALAKAGAAAVLTVGKVPNNPAYWRTRNDKPTLLAKQGLVDQALNRGTATPAVAEKMRRAGRVQLHLALEVQTVPAVNLLARLPGKDPQAPALMIGAHLDHLGIVEGQTYPGADDNSSGVAAALLTARLLSQGTPSKGDTYFGFWTAEEEEVLGSAAFVTRPTFPLARLKGYVNLDMVGRNTTEPELDDLMVLGYQWPAYPAGAREALNDLRKGASLESYGYSPLKMQVKALLPEVGLAPKTGIVRLGGERFDLRSAFYLATDSLPFLQLGIPALSLSSGMHGDYHQPTDTADKVNFVKVVKVAHLLTRLVQES